MTSVCSCLTQRGLLQISSLRRLQEGEDQDDNQRGENRHTLNKTRGEGDHFMSVCKQVYILMTKGFTWLLLLARVCPVINVKHGRKEVSSHTPVVVRDEILVEQTEPRDSFELRRITHKHKSGGHVVSLHTMELIQPHLLWLDLPVERRKLLRHTATT